MPAVTTADAAFTPTLAENRALAAGHRLRAMVHDWFAFFDAMDPDPAPALAVLDGLDLRIDFPGTPPITTHDGFRAWWRAVLERYRLYAHHIQSIDVADAGAGTYTVTDELIWQAQQADGVYTSRRIRHTMTVKLPPGGRPAITAYRAELL